MIPNAMVTALTKLLNGTRDKMLLECFSKTQIPSISRHAMKYGNGYILNCRNSEKVHKY